MYYYNKVLLNICKSQCSNINSVTNLQPVCYTHLYV